MVVGARAAVLALFADAVPPLTPDGDEARRWAERELAKPVYAEAQPTPLDRIAQAIGDFLTRLLGTQLSGGWGPWAAVLAAVVIVIVIVAAFLIWGVPRASRRTRGAAVIFGVDERRSAAELRREAASAAATEDWEAAIVLGFRALARGLDERGIVDTPPGATVHAFARAAGGALPALSGPLESAAAAFDDVRYLRRAGTAALYERVADADAAAMGARAAAEAPAGAPA